MRRRDRLALLVGVALAASGCDWYYNTVPSPDQLWEVIPWFDQMRFQKSVPPYSRLGVPRNTPAGTVPVTGGEPDWSAEWRQGKTATADALKNPTVAGGEPARHGAQTAVIPGTIEAKGDTLYQNFCATCHGPRGAGDGPVGRRMGALPLTSPRARAFTDGYIYSIIRYGGLALMPPYGDRIYDPLDRWAIVDHVRKLQAETPLPPAPPGGPK